MNNRPTIGTRMIVTSDIKHRHPRHLSCETDKMYADLANDIHELTREHFSFMEPEEARNACISLALYFEDIHSNLHLFDAFTCMYQKMYGHYLPFYSTSGPNDPTAERDALRFMVWHSCVAEREERVINPFNEGIKQIVTELLDFWRERKKTMLPNEELADYLYSEETQTNADEVKTVLVWLSRYCPFGRWHTNLSYDNQMSEIKRLMPTADKSMIAYASDCYAMVKQRTWPLSVAPQHVYAEMIRLEMDDPEDELAADIDCMDFKSFGIYEVTGNFDGKVYLKDFLGETFHVNQSDFFGDVRKLAVQNTHLAASFICLNGVWRLNGPCVWSKPAKKQLEKHLERLRQQHHVMNDYRGQYDEFIARHGGERLYFFRNTQEQEKWIREELQLNLENVPLSAEYISRPIAVFFEDNGQMTTCFNARCINHPDNPYYDRDDAEEYGLGFVMTRSYCSTGLLFHLMKHDMLTDAMINDIRGREYGRQTLQDNMDFMARCMRRDIPTDEVIRQRFFRVSEEEDDSMTTLDNGEYTFEEFVKLIAAENVVLSKARKKWEVVRTNRTTTVIRDVDKRIDHQIPTQNLYAAYLTLEPTQIQVAALVPFVGKEKAPAASALLYNIVGQGKSFNNLRKMMQQMMSHGGFEGLVKGLNL